MTSGRAPRVTVLSSIYRDGRFVAEAVESVLQQTFTDFEYLIINDGAVDDSRAIVASFDDPRIRLVDNERNIGLTRSLNRGLALARGELIARFDSNDVCAPERLARQVAFLDAHPEVAVVGSQTRMIGVNGRRIRRAEFWQPTTDLAIRYRSMFQSPISHPTATYRRSVVWDELGGYNEDFPIGQDSELWTRVGARHALANLDEPLVRMRADPTSISSDLERPDRPRHKQQVVELRNAMMATTLKMEIPAEWSARWIESVHARGRLTREELRIAIDILDRCTERFLSLYPAARTDPGVPRTYSILLSGVVAKCALFDRTRVFPVWWRVLAGDKRLALALLPKMLLTFFGGEVPVRMWRAWRDRQTRRGAAVGVKDS